MTRGGGSHIGRWMLCGLPWSALAVAELVPKLPLVVHVVLLVHVVWPLSKGMHALHAACTGIALLIVDVVTPTVAIAIISIAIVLV